MFQQISQINISLWKIKKKKKTQTNEWTKHSVIIIILRLQFSEAASNVNMILLNVDNHMGDISMNGKNIPLNGKYKV